MVVSKAARRYAGAFLSLAVDQKVLEEAYADAQLIAGSIKNSRELLLFLRSPVIRRDKKRAALVALFSARVSPLTLDFLRLLATKGREEELPGICLSFMQQYDTHSGIERVTVTATGQLDSATEKKLAAALAKMTGKKIVLSTRVNPALLGGIQVQIGDTIHDGSVLAKLNRLEDAFINNVA